MTLCVITPRFFMQGCTQEVHLSRFSSSGSWNCGNLEEREDSSKMILEDILIERILAFFVSLSLYMLSEGLAVSVLL